MVTCNIPTVYERDMDLLFMELFATDEGFLNLIRRKVPELPPLSVIDITLSMADAQLGESDITVITQSDEKRIALLIEDKIDAIAMKSQHRRYVARGQKAVKKHEYDGFYVFIFCPRKYYENNTEAKEYQYHVFYEEVLEYLNHSVVPVHSLYRQRIEQALYKAKKPPETQMNQNAIQYFLRYREFQQTYYPQLDLRSKPGTNAWWPTYGTHFGTTYILHKSQVGYVDLTFRNAAGHCLQLQNIAVWLRQHGYEGISAVVTGQASSLRIHVPKLNITSSFDETPEQDLHQCFAAISALTEIAAIFSNAGTLSIMKKDS